MMFVGNQHNSNEFIFLCPMVCFNDVKDNNFSILKENLSHSFKFLYFLRLNYSQNIYSLYINLLLGSLQDSAFPLKSEKHVE